MDLISRANDGDALDLLTFRRIRYSSRLNVWFAWFTFLRPVRLLRKLGAHLPSRVPIAQGSSKFKLKTKELEEAKILVKVTIIYRPAQLVSMVFRPTLGLPSDTDKGTERRPVLSFWIHLKCHAKAAALNAEKPCGTCPTKQRSSRDSYLLLLVKWSLMLVKIVQSLF